MLRMLPGGPVFEAVPEPAPITPGGETETVAPEPEPFQISPEEWNRQTEATGFIMDQLQQLSRMAQPNEPGAIQIPEDSLLSEQDLEVLDRLIQSRVAPFQETREQWMQSEGEARALDVIADDVGQNGDFLLEGSREKARALSENYYADYAQRYGPGSQAAEAAIRHACTDIREWEAAVGKAYMEREQNQLATLAGAPRSPTQPGRPAAQQLTTVEGGNEFDVLSKYFPKNQ